MGPLEAILDVAGHPSDNIASMSFNFWHRLSRILTTGLQPQPIGSADAQGGALTQEETQRRLGVFAPVFERLVGLVRGRVRFPDSYDSWHRDEQADFKRARCGAWGEWGHLRGRGRAGQREKPQGGREGECWGAMLIWRDVGERSGGFCQCPGARGDWGPDGVIAHSVL